MPRACRPDSEARVPNGRLADFLYAIVMPLAKRCMRMAGRSAGFHYENNRFPRLQPKG